MTIFFVRASVPLFRLGGTNPGDTCTMGIGWNVISELDLLESFNRLFASFLIYRKSHSKVAFSFLSKTISRSSDDSSLLKQERGELGGGITPWNPNPEIEGCLGWIHF